MDASQDQDLNDVFRLLENATLLEKAGQRIEAATKYYEGCHLMRQIVSRYSPEDENDPSVVLLREKIQAYTLQAQRLYFDERSVIQPTARKATTPATIMLPTGTSDDISVLTLPGHQSSIRSDVHRKIGIGNARLEEAIQLEERNKSNTTNKESIIQSYFNAAEVYLSAMKVSEESSQPLPTDVQRRLEACLDRAEALKKPIM